MYVSLCVYMCMCVFVQVRAQVCTQRLCNGRIDGVTVQVENSSKASYKEINALLYVYVCTRMVIPIR